MLQINFREIEWLGQDLSDSGDGQVISFLNTVVNFGLHKMQGIS
jgi:hypothetical protein